MHGKVIPFAGVNLEVFESGSGAPLLFLNSVQGFDGRDEIAGLLSARHRLIAPSHPGFGKSSLPDGIDNVDDIAYVYLELLGCAIGGWIAAEMATKAPERIKRLVMVGPVGVKLGPVNIKSE